MLRSHAKLKRWMFLLPAIAQESCHPKLLLWRIDHLASFLLGSACRPLGCGLCQARFPARISSRSHAPEEDRRDSAAAVPEAFGRCKEHTSCFRLVAWQ